MYPSAFKPTAENTTAVVYISTGCGLRQPTAYITHVGLSEANNFIGEICSNRRYWFLFAPTSGSCSIMHTQVVVLFCFYHNRIAIDVWSATLFCTTTFAATQSFYTSNAENNKQGPHLSYHLAAAPLGQPQQIVPKHTEASVLIVRPLHDPTDARPPSQAPLRHRRNPTADGDPAMYAPSCASRECTA